MDWNDLKYILAIAEHGSLNSAARSLGVTHSTVYRRVQNLEQSLQVQLVIPYRQGYRLSKEGDQLLQHAKVIAAEVDAIELKIGGKSPQMQGLIRLTAPGAIANQDLPLILTEFRQHHPGVYFEVLEGSQAFDLHRREADIAVRGTANPPGHLIGRKVASSGWGLFCAPNLAKEFQLMTLEQLLMQQWVGYSDGLGSPGAKWVRRHINEGQVASQFNSSDGCSGACLAGLGLAALPCTRQNLAQLHRLMPLPGHGDEGLWVLMPKELKHSAKIFGFYQFLVEALIKLYKPPA